MASSNDPNTTINTTNSHKTSISHILNKKSNKVVLARTPLSLPPKPATQRKDSPISMNRPAIFPLVDFHSFARLPAEMQDIVWKYTSFDIPQTVAIEFINGQYRHRTWFDKIPGVVLATRGSRAVALRHFTLVEFFPIPPPDDRIWRFERLRATRALERSYRFQAQTPQKEWQQPLVAPNIPLGETGKLTWAENGIDDLCNMSGYVWELNPQGDRRIHLRELDRQIHQVLDAINTLPVRFQFCKEWEECFELFHDDCQACLRQYIEIARSNRNIITTDMQVATRVSRSITTPLDCQNTVTLAYLLCNPFEIPLFSEDTEERVPKTERISEQPRWKKRDLWLDGQAPNAPVPQTPKSVKEERKGKEAPFWAFINFHRANFQFQVGLQPERPFPTFRLSNVHDSLVLGASKLDARAQLGYFNESSEGFQHRPQILLPPTPKVPSQYHMIRNLSIPFILPPRDPSSNLPADATLQTYIQSEVPKFCDEVISSILAKFQGLESLDLFVGQQRGVERGEKLVTREWRDFQHLIVESDGARLGKVEFMYIDAEIRQWVFAREWKGEIRLVAEILESRFWMGFVEGGVREGNDDGEAGENLDNFEDLFMEDGSGDEQGWENDDGDDLDVEE